MSACEVRRASELEVAPLSMSDSIYAIIHGGGEGVIHCCPGS